jgi:CheY-like chemotaxis protein
MNASYGNPASNVDASNEIETPSLAVSSRNDEFLAMLGHERRNPLSALSGALELWPITIPDSVQSDGLRDLMLQQVEQLLRLSNDLVNAARGAHSLDFRRDQVNLKRPIAAACEEVRPFAERRGHKLKLNLPAEPLIVCGDALRLVQVFANLVQNAAKFTGENGKLDIVVERHGEWAAVRVRDNGKGIEPRRLALMFAVHPPQARTSEHGNDGLGIGLPLVRRIVEEHGGNVTAHSDGPGQGSVFTVILPLLNIATGDKPPVSPHSEHHRGTPHLPNQRIVVVDDQRCLAEMLAKMLRSLGQTVTVSENGASAIQIALDERPEVIFLDIVMCGLDGYEVARRLRGHAALDGVRLVAVSGHSDQRSKRLAFEAGFNNYLVKPVSMSELVKLLECATITTPIS